MVKYIGNLKESDSSSPIQLEKDGDIDVIMTTSQAQQEEIIDMVKGNSEDGYGETKHFIKDGCMPNPFVQQLKEEEIDAGLNEAGASFSTPKSMEKEVRNECELKDIQDKIQVEGYSSKYFEKENDILRKYHDVIAKEEDVSDGVKEFSGARSLLKELNSTFIVMIPKCPRADSMNSFHPISLCNSFYKIISNVLMLRLFSILSDIISRQQNGFVLGRQILDSIITVHENIYSLEVSCKEGFLMKLDLSKAYDIIDWHFLSRMLHAFGFCDRVIKLIW
ncbi:uncharacterized protein LOC131856829 [Cryptomeria japonica]|uniref:uncharacterized protein LOC131856829 n=1 Tax=Cryptomeria japonica TaxID=3369 RepID=UPI0027DA772E|nr:uncharacterized protein LOC131856829 [Cryptomeria japonica]